MSFSAQNRASRAHKPRLEAFLRMVAGALAAWFILCFLGVALLSLFYPYHLEWMEGQAMDVLGRIMRGEPLYLEPSIEYVPFIYPPLYFYAAAAMAKLVGMEFYAARAVSLLSIIGVGMISYLWLRREGGSRMIALIATGLFFSTYILSSRWFDIGRVDSFYLFLLFAAMYVFTHYQSMRASLLAAGLLTIAFFTKQNTLLAVLPLLAWGIVANWRHGLVTAWVFGVAVISLSIVCDIATDGWFYFYVYDLPSAHAIDARYYLGFWTEDLIPKLWPLMLVLGIGAFAAWKHDRRRLFWYGALLAGLVGAAYAGRLHRYGWMNVLMTAHLGMAFTAGISLIVLVRARREMLVMICLVLITLQMLLLLYDPLRYTPDDEMVKEGDAFIEQLKSMDGDVFLPRLQFVPEKAGKRSYSYGFAAIDVYIAGPTGRDEARRALADDLNRAIASQRFSAVITNIRADITGVQRYYKHAGHIDHPRMLAGFQPPRSVVMVPKTQQEMAND